MHRRTLLCGLLGVLTTEAWSQDAPKLFILPKGVTSPRLNFGTAPKHDFSLEGWLVANGALASRLTYRELFESIGTTAGVGDGISTFGPPAFPIEYRAGEPIRGFAICPFARPWADVADLASFSIDSYI
jgi:Phage Tail Collar Domain